MTILSRVAPYTAGTPVNIKYSYGPGLAAGTYTWIATLYLNSCDASSGNEYGTYEVDIAL